MPGPDSGPTGAPAGVMPVGSLPVQSTLSGEELAAEADNPAPKPVASRPAHAVPDGHAIPLRMLPIPNGRPVPSHMMFVVDAVPWSTLVVTGSWALHTTGAGSAAGGSVTVIVWLAELTASPLVVLLAVTVS